MSKIVSQLDSKGYYAGPVVADESPLEPGVHLIPGGAVDCAPPVVPAGHRARWAGAEFALEAIPVPVVDPVEPAPPVEPSISPRQIRQALTAAGLRSAVETSVAAGDQNLKDWYEYSTTFERHNAQVLVMAAALGVSEQQLDELWALGASL